VPDRRAFCDIDAGGTPALGCLGERRHRVNRVCELAEAGHATARRTTRNPPGDRRREDPARVCTRPRPHRHRPRTQRRRRAHRTRRSPVVAVDGARRPHYRSAL